MALAPEKLPNGGCRASLSSSRVALLAHEGVSLPDLAGLWNPSLLSALVPVLVNSDASFKTSPSELRCFE